MKGEWGIRIRCLRGSILVRLEGRKLRTLHATTCPDMYTDETSSSQRMSESIGGIARDSNFDNS